MKYNQSNSLVRYSITPEQFAKIQIEHIIENDACHLVSLFKESLIFDEDTDFLRRFYYKKESFHRLNKLFDFYNASSMVFPNYTALVEGKYIYKNIMKKQKVIDLIEAMDEQKEKETIDTEEEKVFETKTYESIAFECDTSKIKEMFDINNNNDSIEDIERFTNKLTDIVDNAKSDTFRINTNLNKSSLYFLLHKNIINSINNRTLTTETTMNNTNNKNNKIVKEKDNNHYQRNKIKLSLAPDIKLTLSNIKAKITNQLNPFLTHRQVPTMPIIEVKPPITHRKPSIHILSIGKEIKLKQSRLAINHNYMQSMPSELNSYRAIKKRKINKSGLYEQCNTSSGFKNPLTITAYSNKYSMKSSRININDKIRKNLNLFTSIGWKSERKQGKRCFKIIK